MSNSKHKNNESVYKGIRFKYEMVDAVDKIDDNFSAFVKQAVAEKLERSQNKEQL